MSSGITRKLVAYFILVIITFSIIIGVVFSISYQRQTKNTIKDSLVHESEMIVSLIETKGTLYLTEAEVSSLLASMSLEDVQVWVVSDSGVITKLTTTKMGMGMMREASSRYNGCTFRTIVTTTWASTRRTAGAIT